MEKFSKFKPAGQMRPDWGGSTPKESIPQKMKMQLESINIDSDGFPYLQKLRVGSECEIRVKIKKTGERIEESQNIGDKKKKEARITLEIVSISEPDAKDDYAKLLEDNMKEED